MAVRGDNVLARAGYDVQDLRVLKDGDELPFPDGAPLSWAEEFAGVTLAIRRDLYLQLVGRYLADGSTRTLRMDLRIGNSHAGDVIV